MTLGDWLKNNAWALTIAFCVLVGNFTLYGYRISQLEDRTAANTNAIITLNNNNTQTQISLARIETDLTYIKAAINKIVPY